jgi:hypothetical protein
MKNRVYQDRLAPRSLLQRKFRIGAIGVKLWELVGGVTE